MATPSGSNTFLLSWEASGKMVAGYSKNVEKFTVNRVAQYITTDVTAGIYQEYDSSQAVRVDLNRFIWDDNTPAPTGQDNLAGWNNKPFLTQRFAPTFTVGQLAVTQADWDLVARCAGQAGSQAMTWRTIQYLTALQNAPWGAHAIAVQTGTSAAPVAGSVADANADWASGSSTNPVIQKALLAAALQINRDTLDTVGVADLKLLLSPEMAVAIANTAEVHDFVARSPFALAQLKGDEPNQNAIWGLPSHLYGFEVQVEGAVQTTSIARSPASFNDPVGRIFPANGCYLISRVGGLDGIPGAPTFSTVVGFVQEDMTVETKYDSDNRYTWGRVVQNLCFVVPSTASGVKFTGCFASKLPAA